VSTPWHISPIESHELARFTIRARKALQLANQEAQRLNHDYIGTEHLLLGMVKDEIGVASQVLKGLDFNLHKARTEVEKVAPPNSHQPMMGTLPRNGDAQKALGCALEEAKNLNHPRVGTGHILLGLISSPGTISQQVLSELDQCPEEVRARVHAGLRHPNYDRIESYCGVKGPIPEFLLLASRAKTTFASAMLRDVFWSLPIGIVVGLVTQSWTAFAVTFVLVIVGYICRRGYLDPKGPRDRLRA